MSAVKARTSRRSKYSGLAANVLIAVAGLIFINRQSLADHAIVLGYQPTSQVQQLVEQSAMSDLGEFYFYASTPAVQSRQDFNQSCRGYSAEGATLGCYRGGRIYIYDVTDERLTGVKAVTAAHEMLHAAYARLSEAEQERINKLLEKHYESLSEERLDKRLDMYERVQPGTRYVELHAIFGTEHDNLPDELEQHYSIYFDDRAKVLAAFNQYNDQFIALEERATTLRTEADQLADQIETSTAEYNRSIRQLSREITDFNSRATKVSSESERQSLLDERLQLMSRTSELEQTHSSINNMIARYNQIAGELKEISIEVGDLSNSLDSTKLEPTPQI